VQLSEEGERKLADQRMMEWSKDQEEYTERQFQETQKGRSEAGRTEGHFQERRRRGRQTDEELTEEDEQEARRRSEIFDRQTKRMLEEAKEEANRAIQAKVEKYVAALEEADTKDPETARELRNMTYERYSDAIADEARKIWLERKEEARKEAARFEEEKKGQEISQLKGRTKAAEARLQMEETRLKYTKEHLDNEEKDLQQIQKDIRIAQSKGQSIFEPLKKGWIGGESLWKK
jgi:hypothetical protein